MSRQHRKSYKQIQSMLSPQCQASLMTTIGFILKGRELWNGRCVCGLRITWRWGSLGTLVLWGVGRQLVCLILGCHTKVFYFSCYFSLMTDCFTVSTGVWQAVEAFSAACKVCEYHHTKHLMQQAHWGIWALFFKIGFQFHLFKDKVNWISPVPLSFV